MIDLRKALYCITMQRQFGTYQLGTKVGVMVKTPAPFETLTHLPEGEVVLFCDCGEGTVTIESPLTPKDIQDNLRRESFVTTAGNATVVPRSMVQEIVTGDVEPACKVDVITPIIAEELERHMKLYSDAREWITRMAFDVVAKLERSVIEDHK